MNQLNNKRFIGRWRYMTGDEYQEERYYVDVSLCQTSPLKKRRSANGDWRGVKIHHCAKDNDGEEHRWESSSIRPYVQGDGCDGTTDENIHLIARMVLGYLGLNYADLYQSAYPVESRDDVISGPSLRELDAIIIEETFIPKMADIDFLLLVDDLMSINNYEFAIVVGDCLIEKGLLSPRWIWERSDEEFEQRKNKAMDLYLRHHELNANPQREAFFANL